MTLTAVTLHAYALGTEDDVSEYLKLPATPTGTVLEIFQRVINAATDRVESYCMRPFIDRSLDEYYDGPGNRRLFLRAHPISAISSIDHLNHLGNSDRTYSGTDLVIDTAHGIVHLSNGSTFSEGLRNWRVQYTGGFGAAISNVPDDVILGFLKLCAEYWREYSNRSDDITSMTTGDGQTIFYSQEDMPRSVKALLRHFKVPPMGTI